MIPWPKLEDSQSKGSLGQAFYLFWQQRRVQILCCYCLNRQEGLAQGALIMADLATNSTITWLKMKPAQKAHKNGV